MPCVHVRRVVLLGLGKIVLAVVFGSYLEKLIAVFPASLLGVILFFSGVELAVVGAKRKVDYPCLVTAAAGLGLASTWMGVVAGTFAAIVPKLAPHSWHMPRMGAAPGAGKLWHRYDQAAPVDVGAATSATTEEAKDCPAAGGARAVEVALPPVLRYG